MHLTFLVFERRDGGPAKTISATPSWEKIHTDLTSLRYLPKSDNGTAAELIFQENRVWMRMEADGYLRVGEKPEEGMRYLVTVQGKGDFIDFQLFNPGIGDELEYIDLERDCTDYGLLPSCCLIKQDLMLQAAKHFFDHAERDENLHWWQSDSLQHFVDEKYEEERRLREPKEHHE